MDGVILGDGPLGWAIAIALVGHGDCARVLGRPAAGIHAARDLGGADVAFDASRGDAVARNVDALLAAGVRRTVIATTAWDADGGDDRFDPVLDDLLLPEVAMAS
jgi:hypothetical protein